MRKILSMLLAVCMVFTLPSLSVLASAADALSGANGEITAFAELSEMEKAVPLGTAKVDLNLPATLTATVRAVTNSGSTEETVKNSGSTEETTVSVPVTWASSPEYDRDTADVYVFTPEIEGYTVSASLPEITVTEGNVPNMLMMLGTGSTTSVGTETGLRTAVGTGGTGNTVVLTADITGITTQLGIARDVTLDLNGHNLTIDLPNIFGQHFNGIKIASGKTFTVTDSKPRTNKLTVINEEKGVAPDTGAAINTSDGTIIIESGTVEATGGLYGAGIGGGEFRDGGTIIINGSAQVTATGGSNGAGIGGGYGDDGGTITIGGSAQVTATGSNGGAGIGGGIGDEGSGGASGTIAISGGTVKATGNGGGADIGTGLGGTGGTVTITGGSIQAGSITSPANGDGASVYKATFTVPGAIDGTTVNGLTITKAAGADYTYGTDGITTVDTNKVYVYLPAGAAELTYGGKTYTATVIDDTAVFEAPITTPETTPTAVFTATGTDAGTLTNIASGMQYSVDGGSAWTAVAGTNADITDVSAANGVKVKKPGNGTTTTDSGIQDIAVTKGGAVTGITAVGCTTNSNNDGKLKGVTTAMEYKLSSASAWTPGTGSDITGLANGAYDVRVKASGSMLAGDSSAFPVAAFVPTSAVAPTILPNLPSAEQLVNAGDSVTLSLLANVTDGGTLSYQWYSNAINSDMGSVAIMGAKGTSYTVTASTSPNHTDYYYCVVTNTNGTYKNTATSNIAPVRTRNNVATIESFNLVSPSATGTVDNALNTVSITVPYGTNVTALTPTITLTDAGASVSPAGAQDFTSPVAYTVTAENGTAKPYTVTVNIAPDPDIAIVEAAKTAAESTAYISMTQAAVTSDSVIETALKVTAQTAVNNSDITVSVNKISYTAPVAGTSADSSGTNGSYLFTITVSKGAWVLTTIQKTVTITATAYTGGNSNKSSSSSSTQSTTKAGTQIKVDKTNNDATVTTVPDSVTTAGDTTNINTSVPSVTLDNTLTSTNGDTVDTAKKTAVTINVPTEDIKQQLNAKQNVELTVTVPSGVSKDTNENLAVTINANKEILEAAKAALSDVTIKIKDADTQQLAYSWTFKGADLAKSTTPMTDVNIAMSVRLTTEVPKVNVLTPSNKGLVLSFDHSGVLPSVASVKFSALEKGFKPGQTLYFYYYNPTTKQIESLGKDAYTVDADGNVTVQIYHCSDYVLLPNAARSITLDTRTYTMKPKNSYEIGVKLTNSPNTTIKAYSSTKGVANVTVLKNGNVKATGVKPGLTYIMIDVYDKKNKFLTHASVRVTVQNGVKPNGNSARQYGIF